MAMACCDNPTERGIFCPTITHIFRTYDDVLQNSTANTWNRNTGLHLFTMPHAHLLEIRKLQLAVKKKLVHKGVDFYVQNALKLTFEHLQFQKFSGGYTPDLR